MDKIRFIEINYHHHRDFTHPGDVIAKHLPSNYFLQEFRAYADITLVKHAQCSTEFDEGGLHYAFFNGYNSFFYPALPAHRYITSRDPDLILVQGFVFPLQVYLLRKRVGKRPVILLQHHGEVPFRKKRTFQKMMAGVVDGWLFASSGQAATWLTSGIIKHGEDCFEIFPATSWFGPGDRQAARASLGMKEGLQLLWVGRLNRNKDPYTVIEAFRVAEKQLPGATLHLVFTEPVDDESVRQLCQVKSSSIRVYGPQPHAKMESWYNACDYLISSSHTEGASYAIMEAMACGCVPIVSEIPASMKMAGELGLHFPPGDARRLAEILLSTPSLNRTGLSTKAHDLFERNMSAAAISKRLMEIYVMVRR